MTTTRALTTTKTNHTVGGLLITYKLITDKLKTKMYKLIT